MKSRIIAFLLVAAVTSVVAQAQAPVPAPAAQLRAKRMAKVLGLSAAQKQQIKTVRQQAQLSAKPVADQMAQNRQALTAAIKAGNAAQIQALSKTQGDLRGQALTIHSQARAQIYAGLTNDQRTKFDAMQARVQRRMAKRPANPTSSN